MMIKLLSFTVCAFLLTGCGPAAYRITMQKPVVSDSMTYEDKMIRVKYQVQKDDMNCNMENVVQQYCDYTGFDFIFENKTDKIITIDWNKITFENSQGISGGVFHNGIPFIDRNLIKAPSIIPPNSKINDVIVPCDAAMLGDNGNWHVSLFPSPRKYPDITCGIYFPIQIGEEIKLYKFEFSVKAEQ